MKSVSNRFSTMLGAGLFLLFGVVFAQVLPEESLIEQNPDETIEGADVLDIVTDVTPPPVASTSDATMSNESSSTSEMIAEESETSSTTPINEVVEISTASSTGSIDEVVAEAILPFELADISSKRDIEKPSQCQNESARELFDTIGECVRYVLQNASEERVERPQPEKEPQESLE